MYYYDLNESFPEAKEKLGKWMGVAQNYGDDLTYWILTADTEELIVQSYVQCTKDTTKPNAYLVDDLKKEIQADQERLKEYKEGFVSPIH